MFWALVQVTDSLKGSFDAEVEIKDGMVVLATREGVDNWRCEIESVKAAKDNDAKIKAERGRCERSLPRNQGGTVDFDSSFF